MVFKISDIINHCKEKLKRNDIQLDVDSLTPEHYAFLRRMKKVFGDKEFARALGLPPRYLNIIEKNL
jgi:hypothetical protein